MNAAITGKKKKTKIALIAGARKKYAAVCDCLKLNI
jgi:hypothetical protein